LGVYYRNSIGWIIFLSVYPKTILQTEYTITDDDAAAVIVDCFNKE
jgi:hypothetical protein